MSKFPDIQAPLISISDGRLVMVCQRNMNLVSEIPGP